MRSSAILRLLSTLSWRNIFRNKRRSLLTFLAVSAGVWCCVSLSAIARGMSNQLAKDKISLLSGHVQIHAKGYIDDPTIEHKFDQDNALIEFIIKHPLTQRFAQRVRVPAVVMSERESLGVTLVGIEPEEERGLSFIGESRLEGSMLGGADDDSVVVGNRLAELLTTSIGKRLVIMSEDEKNVISDRGFVVKGKYHAELETTEKSFVFVGRKVAQQMLGMKDMISEISILTSDREKAEHLADSLKAQFPQYEVHTWRELNPLVVSILKMQNKILDFWFLIVLLTVAFGFMNTLFMAIFERMREIAMMSALGMKSIWLILEVLFESLFVLLGASALGNFAAYLTVLSLSGGIDVSSFAKGTEIVGIRSMIYPMLYARDMISANLMLFTIGILSSLYPAWRASRGTAAQALQRI